MDISLEAFIFFNMALILLTKYIGINRETQTLVRQEQKHISHRKDICQWNKSCWEHRDRCERFVKSALHWLHYLRIKHEWTKKLSGILNAMISNDHSQYPQYCFVSRFQNIQMCSTCKHTTLQRGTINVMITAVQSAQSLHMLDISHLA